MKYLLLLALLFLVFVNAAEITNEDEDNMAARESEEIVSVDDCEADISSQSNSENNSDNFEMSAIARFMLDVEDDEEKEDIDIGTTIILPAENVTEAIEAAVIFEDLINSSQSANTLKPKLTLNWTTEDVKENN